MQAVPSGDAAQRCDSDIRAQQPPPAGMPMQLPSAVAPLASRLTRYILSTAITCIKSIHKQLQHSPSLDTSLLPEMEEQGDKLDERGPEFQFVRSGFAVSAFGLTIRKEFGVEGRLGRLWSCGFVYEPFPLIQTRDPANAVDVERKPDHLAVPFQYLPCASAWTAGSVLSLQKSWTGKPENRTTAKAEYQRQLLAWMPSSATTPQSPLFKIFMSALAT
ncbi:hypothetical protein AK812_SmicGene42711 [Symbiodinium microadriaticum]|uniref:Uncharacterized protein n=1 Tax=Symbiodinium microadriaticum TaxID=2951 RepID=A0A1Q9C2V4_SYMMI|nr:hypothetical protein AK812_SmicGene42711 [Symbiodinium microadriaticum]